MIYGKYTLIYHNKCIKSVIMCQQVAAMPERFEENYQRTPLGAWKSEVNSLRSGMLCI